MSEQNNNCEQCGNNKEPDGLCFDCDHQRECGICYEKKRWGCDGGDFIQGNNCDHRVCVDCSVKIICCPFCRKSWEFFEDSDGEEEEDEEARFQAEHLAEFPDHHYCTECVCCIGCGCCGCGEEDEEEDPENNVEYRVEVRFIIDYEGEQDSVWVENEHGSVEFLNRGEAIAKYRELVVELAEDRVYCRMPVRAVAVTRSTVRYREDEGEVIAITDFTTGEPTTREEECRNCYDENHDWCTGLVTSNEHDGMCYACFSHI